MSTKDPNMKVIFGSDTKDFDKGAKQVKQGLKDLDKSSESMLSSLSNAFGVPSAKVEQMTSAVRGLGYKLVETGNEGAKALGSVLAKIGPLQAGIAGLGLAAAIAGFKQLKAEADNFKSTIDGMNMSMATAAYISTYKQVLHDVNSDTGRQVAEAMDKWERGFGKFKAQLGATFSTAMGQDSKWYDAISPSGLIRAWRTVKDASQEAEAAADRNAARASQLADIQKEELQVRRDVADIEVKIAEQRRILRDRTADAATRTEAEANLRELIADRTQKQTSIAERLYTITQEMTDEAGSTYEEVANCVALYEQWQGRIAATENEMAGVDRYASSIAGNTSKAAQAAKEYAEAVKKMAEVQSKWSGMTAVSAAGINPSFPGVQTPTESIIPQSQVDRWTNALRAQFGDVTIGVRFKVADPDEIKNITSQVTSLMESAVLRTGELIGNLIGTLAGGGDAWGEFKSAALSAFGDMAIAVGKIAISLGVAASGIDVALRDTGQWYVAVAAGAALVALGAAVKSSLSAVAGGDYSAAGGGGGYSGGASGGSSGNYETREVKVYVTGTLEADGDKLITVINNTNRNNYYKG